MRFCQYSLVQLLLILSPWLADAKNLVLVSPDSVPPEIVLSVSAEDQETFAAQDLRKYLSQITGQKLSVVGTATWKKPAIFIGNVPENADLIDVVNKHNLGRDGFVLDISEVGVRILGGSKFGTAYGVDELLERLGVRWLFPGEWGDVVPNKDKLTIPFGQFTDKPVFSVREMHSAWVGEEAGDWYRRSRHNRTGFFGHSRLINPKKYGRQHPEWYAEMNGIRQAPPPENYKLCHANQLMVEASINEVLDEIRERKADGTTRVHIGYKHLAEDYSIISISPTDGGGFCQCSECLKMGSLSDRLQIFANRIAMAVREKYPDYSVGYYGSNSEAQKPPTVKAVPGVVVFPTTWTREFFKPISSFSNKVYREKLTEFASQSPVMVLRDFDGLAAWWGYGPLSLADIHAKDYQAYDALGIKGIVTEAHTGWGPWGYHYYLLGKLWWNPRADLPALKRDFIASAYGDASAPMTKYYELLDKAVVYPSASVLYAMRTHLAEAAQIATAPGAQLRIDYLRAHYFLWDIVQKQEAGQASPEEIDLFHRMLRSIDPHVSTFSNNRRFKSNFPLESFLGSALPPLTREELKKTLAGVILKIPGKDFSAWVDQSDLRLIPWHDAEAKVEPSLSMNLRYGPATILIYATKGERIHVAQFAKRWKEFDTAYDLKDPDLTTLATGTATSETIIDAVAPGTGVYSLTLSLGGYYPEIHVSNQWAVVKASSVAQRVHPMGRVKKVYFFVPKGTTEFMISTKAYEPLTIQVHGPDQNPILLPTITQTSKNFEDHHITVPAGSDGQPWRMEMTGDNKDVYLSGIPPFLASEPTRLLVPLP
ncbi:MAG: DUF4838 domain-containing protein [Verrucomicrobia bacterium]|nr:DUF4838 domain-containing protein [Verrucomicrobiota bacterium]